MIFETRHPSKAAMRRLTSNFRTCYTLTDNYDGYLAYQNAYSFWGTNSDTRPRETHLSDLESVVDGGNYQDHKSGRTAIKNHRIMDPCRALAFKKSPTRPVFDLSPLSCPCGRS